MDTIDMNIYWKRKDIKSNEKYEIFHDSNGFKYHYYLDTKQYLAICTINDCNNVVCRKKDRLCNRHCKHTKSCIHNGCNIIPKFNYLDIKTGLYCKNHALPNMIDVISKRCLLCNTHPSYNYIGEKIGIYCKDHALVDMINVKGKCHYESCSKHANYNIPTEKTGIFCKIHANENMINVKTSICNYNGCDKQPTYNFPGNSVRLYCKNHCLEGMVDVAHKKCEYTGCNTRPGFNYPGENIAIYCKKHMLEDMIDIKKKTCLFNKCCARPSFNYPDNKDPLYCKKHILDGMINIVSKRCQYSSCNKIPTFNYPNCNNSIYCKLHALEGMVDNHNKKCQYDGCDSRAHYGLIFESVRYCALHKTENDYRYNYPKCLSINCSNRSYYTDDGTSYPKRCEIHKINTDINVIEKSCFKCGLKYFIPDNRNTCNDCDEYFNKNIKNMKEHMIGQALLSNNIKIESHDRRITNGCSMRRPDYIIDKLLYKIIIEVDENQHILYNKDCEILRLKQIYFDLGGSPIVIIRYNPDEYINANNVKISASSNRLRYLIEYIQRFDNIKEWKSPISIFYMFYDGYDGNPSKYELDPYH